MRRRIPVYLRAAYPGQTEIIRCLKTSDPRLARSRAIFALADIEGEFERKKSQCALNVVLLKADWTNTNPALASELARWTRSRPGRRADRSRFQTDLSCA